MARNCQKTCDKKCQQKGNGGNSGNGGEEINVFFTILKIFLGFLLLNKYFVCVMLLIPMFPSR